MEQYIKNLENIGLSESEASIYLAALTLGPTSIIKMAQKAGLTRQMVYTLMPKLKELGLIKEVTNGARRHFEAINPDVLKDRAQKISKDIDELIPVLKSRQATNSAIPMISVYENPASMRDWYRHVMAEMEDGDEFLVWESGKNWFDLDPEFYKSFVEFKDSKKITNLVISPDTPQARELMGNIVGKGSVINFRYLEDAWQGNVDMWVWRDEVCYLTIRESATNLIVIKSADLAEIEKVKFYDMWEKLQA